MAERSPRPVDAELEAALTRLGARLAFPPTPDLAPAVRARIAAYPRARRGVLPALLARPWRLAAGVAVLLLATAIALGASPGARSAIADLLGLRGERIHVVPHLPSITPPVPSPLPSPTPALAPSVPEPPATALPATSTPGATPSAGQRLQLGERVSSADAQVRVQFAILRPTLSELGEPDEVYLQEPPAGGEVSFVYLARPALPPSAQAGVGLILSQFRGTVQAEFFGKLIGPNTRLEPVTVNGGRGWWIEGAPHGFFYLDPNGRTRQETLRLAGNTLLWEQAGLTLRLEGQVTRDEALRIAESVR